MFERRVFGNLKVPFLPLGTSLKYFILNLNAKWCFIKNESLLPLSTKIQYVSQPTTWSWSNKGLESVRGKAWRSRFCSIPSLPLSAPSSRPAQWTAKWAGDSIKSQKNRVTSLSVSAAAADASSGPDSLEKSALNPRVHSPARCNLQAGKY